MRLIEATPAEQMRDQVAARFAEAYGAPPQRIGFAPGRVNLIGEHVDYNGGPCLPIPLRHGTWAAYTPAADAVLHCTTGEHGEVVERGFSQPGDGTWSDYVAGVLWASQATTGAHIAIASTVPTGAGLSSSAALECAVGAALGLRGQRLADVAVAAERDYVGAPTGGLDQTVAVFGAQDHALLIDFADGSHRQVPFRPADHGLALLVVDTLVKHALADGEGGYAQRRRQCEEAAAILGVDTLAQAGDLGSLDGLLLRRARHVVTETARVHEAAGALGRDDWGRFGGLMVDSHASLRDDFEVTCPELDLVVDTCLDTGALGARMTGGGFGGSAIALVRADQVSDVAAAVERAFHSRSWRVPTFLLAQAGAPAS